MDTELRAELLARCREDQRVREAVTRSGLGPVAEYEALMHGRD